MIAYDLESTPLEIRTNRDFDSKDQFKVSVYAKAKSIVGVIWLKWDSSSPRYRLAFCMKSFSDLPIPLPAGSQKVWRITVGKSSDARSVQIHCNNVEVLNMEITDSLCEVGSWKNYWMKDRTQISFNSKDTVCEFYRPYTGNANYW